MDVSYKLLEEGHPDRLQPTSCPPCRPRAVKLMAVLVALLTPDVVDDLLRLMRALLTDERLTRCGRGGRGRQSARAHTYWEWRGVTRCVAGAVRSVRAGLGKERFAALCAAVAVVYRLPPGTFCCVGLVPGLKGPACCCLWVLRLYTFSLKPIHMPTHVFAHTHPLHHTTHTTRCVQVDGCSRGCCLRGRPHGTGCPRPGQPV